MGGLQVIRGPKPSAVRWLPAKKVQLARSPSAAQVGRPSRGQQEKPKGQPTAPPFFRRTPETNRAAAEAKIARIQASIAAFDDEDPEEVQILRKALEKAQHQAKILPVETQITHAVQFIERAKKRMVAADEKIRKATEALRISESEKAADILAVSEAEAEVERFRALSAKPATTQVPTIQRPDPQSEIAALKAMLAQLQEEQNAAGEERPRVRQRVTEPRRDSEPMPHTIQELWEWMNSKMLELHDVLQFGGSRNVVFELTSQMADRLHSLQDDVSMRLRCYIRSSWVCEKNDHRSSRSRGSGDLLISSDEEPLVPSTRSTVPASTGALRDVGVHESQFVRNVASRVDEGRPDIAPTQWESGAEFSMGIRPQPHPAEAEREGTEQVFPVGCGGICNLSSL